MTAEFKDHFSDRAANYAIYRPQYPPAVVHYLSSIAPTRRVAWDVGCGSGQMSRMLGDVFDHVVATDASLGQLARAVAHPRLRYVAATAERAPLRGATIDLIVAAQAAHWFDLPRFYAEARRVAKPNTAIALLTYGITVAEEPVKPIVDHFYDTVLADWWPRERRHTENGYRDFEFPFQEIAPPSIEMAVTWTLDQFLGYVGTWSAVRAMEKGMGTANSERFRRDVTKAWGDKPTRRVWWPLGMRVGRLHPLL